MDAPGKRQSKFSPPACPPGKRCPLWSGHSRYAGRAKFTQSEPALGPLEARLGLARVRGSMVRVRALVSVRVGLVLGRGPNARGQLV